MMRYREETICTNPLMIIPTMERENSGFFPEHATSLQGCVLVGLGSSSQTKYMDSVASAGTELGAGQHSTLLNLLLSKQVDSICSGVRVPR